jgi:hypothetical protein
VRGVGDNLDETVHPELAQFAVRRHPRRRGTQCLLSGAP